MAVVQYTTTRTVVETRQIVIDDEAFTAEYGYPVSKASPAVLKNDLLARGQLEEGIVIAATDDGVSMPGFPRAVTPEGVGSTTWRLDGFIYGDEIAILSVTRHDPVSGLTALGATLARWDDMINDHPGTQFNGPWADTIEVPVDATADEVWAAARAAADEQAAAMTAAEIQETTR